MKRYWWLLLVLILLLLWWSFGGSSSAPTIHFATARPTTISNTVSTNGKVEPAEFSAARAETAGVVRRIAVQRGQRVRAGQELLALDPVAAQADLAAAQARVEEAQSELNVLKQGGKASAVADLDDRIRAARETVSTAQRIYDSDKRLFAQQATTRVQLNTDADSLTRAQLNLAALENQKKTVVTSTDRSVAEARLKDARSALALAQHRTGLSIIRSPMDGTIYDFDLKVGTYLEPGKLVAYIGNLDQVKVTVDVDEPDLGRARLNVPVSITTDSHPGKVWWGRVDKLPTQVIALNNRTVGQVSTVIDNPDHDLLPGMSVTATIVSSVVKDALVIPKAALRRLSNKDGAYKLEGNVIHWVPVKVGISDINNVQIVSGLQQGDHVVDRAVDPADAEISDGMRVKAVY
jgi:HlyD family secretion protein